MELLTRTMRAEDTEPLSSAFASWPKPRGLFETYTGRVTEGTLDAVVATVGGDVVGYLLIEPTSSYPPFAAAGIPEIADFNVLRGHQGRGVGTALMDEAERRAGERAAVVGLGVGLYSDYGAAQRMYVKRGYIPDGAGLVRHGEPVPPGSVVAIDDELELMFTKRLGRAS